MQQYWMLYEYTDSEQPDREVIRGYGCVRDAKDAVNKATLNMADRKTQTLLRIWITKLDSEDPVHTLIFGAIPKQGRTMPLDNATKSMVHAYMSGKKVKGKDKGKTKSERRKPHIRVSSEPPVPRWSPYIIVTSVSFLKAGETNGKA